MTVEEISSIFNRTYSKSTLSYKALILAIFWKRGDQFAIR